MFGSLHVVQVLKLESVLSLSSASSIFNQCVKSYLLDLWIYSEVILILHPHHRGPSPPLFSIMWQPNAVHIVAQVSNTRIWDVSSCFSESSPTSPTSKVVGYNVKGWTGHQMTLGFQSWICSDLCGLTSLPLPHPLCSPLCQVPWVGKHTRLLQASLCT